MKTTGFFTTTAVAAIFSLQASAQTVDPCLSALTHDSERYADALVQAFRNKADGISERLGVEAMALGLNTACSSLDTMDDVKFCLNAGGEAESRYMAARTEYWLELQERYLALRDERRCLIPSHDYD